MIAALPAVLCDNGTDHRIRACRAANARRVVKRSARTLALYDCELVTLFDLANDRAVEIRSATPSNAERLGDQNICID